MKNSGSTRTRIWLLFIAMPVSYCTAVLLVLVFKPFFKGLPTFLFWVLLLATLIAIDRLFLTIFGNGRITWRQRITLLVIFLVSLAGIAILSTVPPL